MENQHLPYVAGGVTSVESQQSDLFEVYFKAERVQYEVSSYGRIISIYIEI